MGVELFVNVITKDSAVGSEYVAGSGPLVRVLQWSSTAEMDRSGRFSFDVELTADNKTLLRRLRKVRCFVYIGVSYQEIGNGIIDSVSTEIEAGKYILRVTGNDILKELTYRTVGNLELVNTLFGISHASALTAISAFAPSGWTFTPAATPSNDFVYHKYTGDSVLSALIYLVEATRTHFRLSGFRDLRYLEAPVDSGVIASESGDCAIASFRRQDISHDFITRIYPYGSGTDGERYTLAETDRTAPSGYELDKVNNFIRHINHETNYDRIERHMQFAQVSARIANRSVNKITAANMLFDLAFYELYKRVQLFENPIYEIELIGCETVLEPLDSLWIYYNDTEAGEQINQSMWITSATITANSDGIQTTKLVVSAQPIRQRTEAEILLDNLRRVSQMQGITQPENENYSVPFSGSVSSPGTGISFNISFPPNLDTSYDLTLYFTITSGVHALANLFLGRQWSYEAVLVWTGLSSATNLGNGWYRKTIDTGSNNFSSGIYVNVQIDDSFNPVTGTSSIEGFVAVTARKR